MEYITNITNITNIAIIAAIKAGQEILKIYNDSSYDFSVEKKADNSPLTLADKASHFVIFKELENTGIPILSEEGKSIPYSERKDWDTFWLIDPLDGTKEFIKKNGEFTVNIALIKKEEAIMGIIYVPTTKILYFGHPEFGAWKYYSDNEQVDLKVIRKFGSKLPKPKEDNVYTIVGSRSHMNVETQEYIAELNNEHAQLNFISKGSSLKICMVAEGQANEYPRFGPTMEWDTAAGHAIANAAGKKLWLTDFSSELKYNKEYLLNPYFIVK